MLKDMKEAKIDIEELKNQKLQPLSGNKNVSDKQTSKNEYDYREIIQNMNNEISKNN